MNNADKPAYPVSRVPHDGLTKREYIAIMALQGILANQNTIERGISSVLNGNSKGLASHVSGMAIEYADELLKQLES